MTALTRLNDRTSQQPGRLVGAATSPLRQNARVAVWGVKGGVGTTTVSLLAGLALARHQPGPIVVADESLYGSLALRAGTVLPAEPFVAPGSPMEPAIVVGPPAPLWTVLTLLDAPAVGTNADADLIVVSATVDAVLMAAGHDAQLVVMTELTPKPPIDTVAATRRLGDRVIAMPFDPHLATGGPVSWDRLQPATRDAARRLAAELITTLRERVPLHSHETELP